MIEITIHCPEMDRLASAMSELAKVQKWEQQAWADATPNTEAPAQTPTAETPAAEPPKKETTPTCGIEELRAEGIAASREFGKQAVKGILDSLDAPNVSSLKPEQFGKFLDALENLKNG